MRVSLSFEDRLILGYFLLARATACRKHANSGKASADVAELTSEAEHHEALVERLMLPQPAPSPTFETNRPAVNRPPISTDPGEETLT
jgi:hypothetical protein